MDENWILPLVRVVRALVAQNRSLEERVAKLEDDAKRAAERRAHSAQKIREELQALEPFAKDSLDVPPRPDGPAKSL
jgi:hypothetical protein